MLEDMVQSALPNKPEKLPPKPANGRNGKVGAYHQALILQRIMFEMAVESKDGNEKVAAAKAWTTLEEQKRILKNRPLPGSLKPVTPKSKSKDSISSLPIEQDEVS